MATVRFSDQLKDNIRNNARAMFKEGIDKAKADVPAQWPDNLNQSLLPADVIAKFNALTKYKMKKE